MATGTDPARRAGGHRDHNDMKVWEPMSIASSPRRARIASGAHERRVAEVLAAQLADGEGERIRAHVAAECSPYGVCQRCLWMVFNCTCLGRAPWQVDARLATADDVPLRRAA